MTMTKSEQDFRQRRRLEKLRQRKNETDKRKAAARYAKAKINAETFGTDPTHGPAVQSHLASLDGTGRFEQLQQELERQNKKSRETVRLHAERYAKSQSSDGVEVARYSRSAADRKKQRAASLRENALHLALASLVKK